MASKTKKALQKKLNDYALAEKKIKMNQPGCREDFLSKKTELDDIYNKMSKFLGDSNRDQNPTFIELREKIPVLFRAFRKRWGVAYEHLKIVNEELMVDERWNTLCGIAIRIDLCSPEAIDRFNKGETVFRGEIDFAQEKDFIKAEIDRIWDHLHLLGIKKKNKGYQLNKIAISLKVADTKKEIKKKLKQSQELQINKDEIPLSGKVTSDLIGQSMVAKGIYKTPPLGKEIRSASLVRKQLQKLYKLIGATPRRKKIHTPIIRLNNADSFEFQSYEFDNLNKTKTPEALIKALKTRQKINIPSEITNIKSLNKLLENPDLYRAMKIQPEESLIFINQLKNGQKLSPLNIKKLNRLLIEANYPLETPKRANFEQFEEKLNAEGLGINEFTINTKLDIHKSKEDKNIPKPQIVYNPTDGETKKRLKQENPSDKLDANNLKYLYDMVKESNDSPENIASNLLKKHEQRVTPEKTKRIIYLIKEIREQNTT